MDMESWREETFDSFPRFKQTLEEESKHIQHKREFLRKRELIGSHIPMIMRMSTVPMTFANILDRYRQKIK